MIVHLYKAKYYQVFGLSQHLEKTLQAYYPSLLSLQQALQAAVVANPDLVNYSVPYEYPFKEKIRRHEVVLKNARIELKPDGIYKISEMWIKSNPQEVHVEYEGETYTRIEYTTEPLYVNSSQVEVLTKLDVQQEALLVSTATFLERKEPSSVDLYWFDLGVAGRQRMYWETAQEACEAFPEVVIEQHLDLGALFITKAPWRLYSDLACALNLPTDTEDIWQRLRPTATDIEYHIHQGQVTISAYVLASLTTGSKTITVNGQQYTKTVNELPNPVYMRNSKGEKLRFQIELQPSRFQIELQPEKQS